MSDSNIVVVKVRAGVPAPDLATIAPPGLNSGEGMAAAMALFPQVRVSPLFTRQETNPPAGSEVLAPVGAQPPGAPGDRRDYYRLEARSPAEARDLVARLSTSGDVEAAYIEPIYAPPIAVEVVMGSGEKPPSAATPDFSASQLYLGPAPGGLDARFAWTLAPASGPGAGIMAADVEGGWILDHEDFPSGKVVLRHGTMSPEPVWVQHGTACVGEGVAQTDARGVTGFAPAVDRVHCCAIFGHGNTAANAIDNASALLRAGDALLIELHAPGPEATGNGQEGFIAVEYWLANYEAIRRATDRGVVVVQAAGNGAVSLDGAAYGGLFNRTVRDSGAILVGAGAPPSGTFGPDRSRLDFSNWGGSVDVQGYGRGVCTTGYGDLQGDADSRRWYTGQFSGTSSATPMVWGAVILLQSIARQRGGVLPPRVMRELLATTGRVQTDEPSRPRTQKIGPRPDLRAALGQLHTLIGGPAIT